MFSASTGSNHHIPTYVIHNKRQLIHKSSTGPSVFVDHLCCSFRIVLFTHDSNSIITCLVYYTSVGILRLGIDSVIVDNFLLRSTIRNCRNWLRIFFNQCHVESRDHCRYDKTRFVFGVHGTYNVLIVYVCFSFKNIRIHTHNYIF